MATKITTALVAALVVGALMTPNDEHSRAACGSFGGGGSWRWFRRRWIPRRWFPRWWIWFPWGIRTRLRMARGFGFGRRFGFYGGYPYFYGGYGYGCSPYYYGSYECY